MRKKALTFLDPRHEVLEEVDRDSVVSREVDLALDGQEVVALALRAVLGCEGLRVHGDLGRAMLVGLGYHGSEVGKDQTFNYKCSLFNRTRSARISLFNTEILLIASQKR